MAATIQHIELPKKPRALDSSGNNNHGKIYSGRALEFDGVADYLSVGSNVTVSTGAWTVAAWVNISTLPGDTQDNVSSTSSAVSSRFIGVRTTGTAAIWDYGSGWRETSTALNLNTWYRVLWVYDGANEVTIYLNGVADGTGVLSSSSSYDHLKVEHIGAIHGSPVIRHWDGKLSDYQAWDAAFTAADAAYDFANPESLALNASGTALTESNLKLWYPMQDGHRGQQSYILDGANTGLGVEEITNGDFAVSGTLTSNSWSLGWNSGDSGVSISDGALNLVNNGGGFVGRAYANNGVDSYNGVLEVGETYSLTYEVTENIDAATLYYYAGSYVSTSKDVGVHTVTFTATSDFFVFRNGSSNTTIKIDNVSVKAINNKHHATTVFTGDELITTAADRTLAGGNTWNVNDVDWSYDASNDELDYNGAGEGHVLLPRLSAQTEFVLITGRTYRLVFENDNTGDDTKITFRDGLQSEFITADTANNLTFDSDNGDWQTSGGGAVAWGADFGASGGGIGYTPPSSNTSPMMGIRLHTDYLPTVEAGVEYLVSASIKGVTGQLDDFRFTLGSAHSEDFTVTTSHATYSHIITAVDDDQLLIVNGNNGTGQWFVDNVSIKKVGVNDLIAEATYTDGTKTVDFVAPADSSGLMITAAGDSGSFSIESFSVKEIGVASGWTDADQQLDIAQPALQSYNELAWFDGEADYVDINPTTAIWNASDGEWNSVSCWVNETGLDSGIFYWSATFNPGLYVKISGSNHWVGYNTANGELFGISIASTSIVNKWNHWVMNFKRNSNSDGTVISGSDVELFLNGVKQTLSYLSGSNSNGCETTATQNIDLMRAGTSYYTQGVITETSVWKDQLTDAEVLELFNDGKALDALTHSNTNLSAYWRNNGLSAWTNLVDPGTNDGTPTSITETILIPQGVDGSRDAQGFIMNKPRSTSSLNFPSRPQSSTEVPDFGDLDFGTGDFSMECWVQYGFIDNSTFGAGTSGLNVVLSTGSASSSNSEGISLLSTSIDFKFRIGDGDKEDSLDIDPDPLTVGNWYHIVVTREGTALIAYVDGDANNNMTITSGIDVSRSEPLRIGNDRLGSRTYKWPIDAVKFYNKALDSTEVTRNYKATKGSHRN